MVPPPDQVPLLAPGGFQAGWTEAVQVCSSAGPLVLPGRAWPRDGLHLSGGLWLSLDGGPRGDGPAVADGLVLIFERSPDLCVVTRVSEVWPQDHPQALGLNVLGQVPV